MGKFCFTNSGSSFGMGTPGGLIAGGVGSADDIYVDDFALKLRARDLSQESRKAIINKVKVLAAELEESSLPMATQVPN